MSEKKYTLLMQLGPKQGERVPLEGDEFVLGRDPESNWAIEDIEVSRRHARLIYDKESYSIEDLGSTNGTFVNGQRIRTLLPLLPGATIRLGENVLLFYDLLSSEKESDTKTIPAEKAFVDSEDQAEKAVSPEAIKEEDSPEPAALKMTEDESPAEVEAASEAPIKPKRDARSLPSIDLSGSVSFLGNQIGLGILAIVGIGALALIAFLWYVDANFLWCDVFGNLIPACR